ncbi:protein of unknown function [Taphrina deformans PYCC 5710]|uniref:PUM-HD domain-containing protein n=1 Tax=Taphrina deformans (strain PYCC 5710 / ATCC 11124 / CBS 356.35 / IMI 108563 / JCM 9778 / NBRC 8474) TaxID=1097556 RepID=R4XDZ1_TAPDE|nr:protein of unknown function [Taphrina deformans PYCC 5710]|eukprot:CCG84086.1 protein of unknown function [Taphrina deformans PYCC 5710]
MALAGKRKQGSTAVDNGSRPATKKLKPESSEEDSSQDELDNSDIDVDSDFGGPDKFEDQQEEDENTDDDDDDDDDNETDIAETNKQEDALSVPTKRKPLPLDPHKEAASREAHQKQKEKLNDRKAAKPHADTLARSKTLWAQINRKKVPKLERQKIIEELYNLISGSVVDIIFKHDASRVVQACFKYGTEEQRTTILKELKGRLVELSKSTYGKFLVVKMLYYGSAIHREAILSEIHGNVRKLIKHKEAAYVVEDAFREYTTPSQQESLVSEMYGAEFSVFESTGSKTLKQLLDESPEKRDTIMKNLWDSIQGSVKKGSIGFTIIHRALISFLRNANGPEKADVVELIKELLPEIVHTKDGSEVACYVIALSAAKDRKAIMKSFRDHIVKAMCDEYGWMSVISLCMCVDDTVLLTKAYVPDIQKKCIDLFEDRSARKVFLYLLGNLQTRYFTARELAVFAKVQELKQTTSKKDDEQRRKEILQPLGDTLVSALIDNLDGMLNDPNAASLLVEILLNAPSDRGTAVKAVLDHFKGSPAETLQEHSPRFLKTLVQGGFYDKSTKSIATINPTIGFAEKLAPLVTSKAADWSSGSGSFVVVALLETLNKDEQVYRSLLKSMEDAHQSIESAATEGNKGSKIVLSHM